MTVRGGATLYTPEILALAVELTRYPLNHTLALTGDAHSRVCGSRVTLRLALDESGRVAEIGARVSACAIGQAAAALFLRSALGRAQHAIASGQAEISSWLAGGETTPSWPGIEVLAPARGHPARHAAILLPWTAALAALSIRTPAD